MKRPNKEELGKILDPNKISNFVSPDGQLNDDENYESSCIEFYLGLDNWEVKEGLLLLCGIEPQGAVINYGYENSFGAWIDQVVIHHARFIGMTDIYEIPSSDDVMGWLHECNEEYQANHQDLIDPSGKNYQIQSCYSATKELDALYAEYGIYENLLNNKYFNQVWEIRSHFAKRLSRYRLMWKSGRHEDRNPPDYYIDWVLNQGHKIPWLEWAISKGLLSRELSKGKLTAQDKSEPIQIGQDKSDIEDTPLGKLRHQEKTIVKKLEGERYDPLKLPKPPPGKKGVKAEIWAALKEQKKTFQSRNVFNKTWKRLSKNGEIKYQIDDNPIV